MRSPGHREAGVERQLFICYTRSAYQDLSIGHFRSSWLQELRPARPLVNSWKWSALKTWKGGVAPAGTPVPKQDDCQLLRRVSW